MMTDVKRVTPKEEFLQMPLMDRNCEVELYEDCKTRNLLEVCGCVPWEVPGFEVNVQTRLLSDLQFIPQGMNRCDPEGRDCIDRNSSNTFNCSTTCEGIYANVQWDGRKIEVLKEKKREEMIFKSNSVGEASAEAAMLLRRLSHLEQKVEFLEGSLDEKGKELDKEKGEELDKEKYQLLVFEYRKFKANNVKHFRLDSTANSSSFSKSE